MSPRRSAVPVQAWPSIQCVTCLLTKDLFSVKLPGVLTSSLRRARGSRHFPECRWARVSPYIAAPTSSRVEAEAEAVERAQPEVALAAVVVRAGERPGRDVDADGLEGLRRERQRPGSDHLQFGQLGLLPREQVEHDLRAESGRAHAQTGEAGRVRHSSVVSGVEERAEPGARIDDAAPLMGEAHIRQLGERLVEVLRQLLEGLRTLVEFRRDAAAEV